MTARNQLGNEKTEPFIFTQDVTYGTIITLEKELLRPARIKNIRAQFPDGEDGDLHVKILGFDPEGAEITLVNFIGNKDYLNGNDSEFRLKSDIPIRKYSKIVVTGENLEPISVTNPLYRYPIIVEVLVEYTDVVGVK